MGKSACLTYHLSLITVVWMFAWMALAESRTIQFSGREWSVRSTQSGTGPGPNNWDENTVFLDSAGRLHLKIAYHDGKWHCAEVATTQRLGFGRYQFHIEGRLDQLDKNIVLGLFNYPPPDIGPDRTNEIDIEYSKWGIENSLPASYTVYPSKAGRKHTSHQFPVTLSGSYTTQSFTWRSNNILFSSQHGHQNNNRIEEYATWTFAPADAIDVPRSPMPAMINLWLVTGTPPSNGQEVEIVIHSFQFSPL